MKETGILKGLGGVHPPTPSKFRIVRTKNGRPKNCCSSISLFYGALVREASETCPIQGDSARRERTLFLPGNCRKNRRTTLVKCILNRHVIPNESEESLICPKIKLASQGFLVAKRRMVTSALGMTPQMVQYHPDEYRKIDEPLKK